MLIDPTPALRASFLEAVAEFRADTDYPLSWFVEDFERDDNTGPEQFAAYVARVIDERGEGHARRIGFVPMTTLWWVDGDRFLARVAIRHRLNDNLLKAGGHIGYDVRPSARRQGHATAVLRAALVVAGGLGIESALLTCDETNVASQRTIVANGGVFEDSDGLKRRYWVPTGVATAATNPPAVTTTPSPR